MTITTAPRNSPPRLRPQKAPFSWFVSTSDAQLKWLTSGPRNNGIVPPGGFDDE